LAQGQTPLSIRRQRHLGRVVDVEGRRNRLEAASCNGVRTLIVRAGDFFGAPTSNSWFAQGLIKPGKPVRSILYQGKPTVGHAWAYLPDVAPFSACGRANAFDPPVSLGSGLRPQSVRHGIPVDAGTGLSPATPAAARQCNAYRIAGRRAACAHRCGLACHFAWIGCLPNGNRRPIPRAAAQTSSVVR